MTQLLLNLRNPRAMFAFLYDLLITALTFWIALFLRYDTLEVPIARDLDFNRYFFISLFTFGVSFIINGLYKGVWRFSSMHDLIRVVKASFFGVVASLVICFFMTRLIGVPRSMFLIHFLLLVVGLGGGRFIYRFLKDQTSMRAILGGTDPSLKNVLIVGAGRAGEKLVRDILATPSLMLKVVGIVDDDKFKTNSLIHNVKVYGSTQLIPKLTFDLSVDKIFIAIPSANSDEIKRIVSYCKESGVEIKILPRMDQLLSNQVEISLLRNLKIEDLLGRDPVVLDNENLQSMIEHKTILVTGAGGSIGSELCLQIAKFRPKFLVMADYCELFMYELEMKFKEAFPLQSFFPKIIDIRDEEKVDQMFLEFRPDIVFHAAAYKHVPMMEFNPFESIHTNVLGTQIVTKMSLKYGAEKFIMISTDKAVNPTNVMGASKRLAEKVVTENSRRAKEIKAKTQFMSVRFGNVLGSNGSVIPLFRKQIEDRKDITVTHPDIIRYFMSIPEACQLVMQAASMGSGGEIFVLDMGEPVKIVDLAKEMIRLSGLKEGSDINIVYTGLRPGEKLFEELFSDQEQFELTMHGKIRKAKFRDNEDEFEIKLNQLLSMKNPTPDVVVYLIKEMVPEFTHFRLSKESQGQGVHQLNS